MSAARRSARVRRPRSFVNKVLTYERNPPLDYENTALFYARCSGRRPTPTRVWPRTTLTTSSCRPRFRPVVKLYQSQGTEDRDTSIAELNRGRNFFNHDGHAWYDVMDVGGAPNLICEPDDGLADQRPALGICYSIGCWATALTSTPSPSTSSMPRTAAAWRSSATAPTAGARRAIPASATRTASTPSSITRSSPTASPSIGEALALDKVHFIPYSREANVYRWHQYEINLLGDPEMPLWTDTPHRLTLALPASLPKGRTQLMILVRDSLGRPVTNALVCAENSEAYGMGRTDAAGQVVLTVSTAASSALTVTATAGNFLPEVASVPIVSGAYVAPQTIIINDSLGSNDHIPNPGEDIIYVVRFRNDGDQTATGLQARLRYWGHDPNPPVDSGSCPQIVTISDSLASLPDLAAGDSATAVFSFSVSPSAQDRDVADLALVVSDSAAHVWTTQTALAIGAPVLVREGYLFTDSAPGGNGNDRFEPGETVRLRYVVQNTGLGYGYDTRGKITSLDPYLTTVIDHTLFGTVAPESTVASGVLPSVLIDSNCPTPRVARLLDSLTSGTGVWLDTILLMIGDVGLSEDFESGAPGWQHSGINDLWHISTRRSHSGIRALYCGNDTTGLYVPGMNCSIVSPTFVVEPGSQLSFWRWFNVPIYGSDGLYVIIEHDSSGATISDTLDYIGTGGDLAGDMTQVYGDMTRTASVRDRVPGQVVQRPDRVPGQTHLRNLRNLRMGLFDSLPPASGVTAINSDWSEADYDLSRFPAGESLRVRFGFKSDDDASIGEGFYIDDVRVSSTLAGTARFTPAAPSRILLHQNFPNPFGHITSIAYELPRSARVTVKIYSTVGRLVSDLVEERQAAGYYLVNWAATDDRGRRIPAGVYICQLTVSQPDGVARNCRKMVVSR